MQDLQTAKLMLYGCNCWEVHILTALLINALQKAQKRCFPFSLKKKKSCLIKSEMAIKPL